MKEKVKENRTYDQVLKEAEFVIHKIVAENVPKLCRALRDEGAYDLYDDDDDISHSQRNELIKARIMCDMRGVLFCEKVYNIQGIRLLPTRGGKEIGDRAIYERKERRIEPTRVWNKDTGSFETEMRDNEGRGHYIKHISVYSRARDLSKMAKFVELVIDQEISSWAN